MDIPLSADQIGPRPPIIYLSGKMSGLDNFGYETFNEQAKRLRDMGFVVINPAENMGGEQSLPRPIYMQMDSYHVLSCDAVAVLSNWLESDGAKMEVIVALNLGKPILDAETLEPIKIEGYDVRIAD